MSKIVRLIITTPCTRWGRVASGVGCALLAALVFPALIFGYGVGIHLAIFAPLAVGLLAIVRCVDKRAAS